MNICMIYTFTDDGIGLSSSMVASSFGKLVMKESPREGVKEEDLAIALLMMITNNIGWTCVSVSSYVYIYVFTSVYSYIIRIISNNLDISDIMPHSIEFDSFVISFLLYLSVNIKKYTPFYFFVYRTNNLY